MNWSSYRQLNFTAQCVDKKYSHSSRSRFRYTRRATRSRGERARYESDDDDVCMSVETFIRARCEPSTPLIKTARHAATDVSNYYTQNPIRALAPLLPPLQPKPTTHSRRLLSTSREREAEKNQEAKINSSTSERRFKFIFFFKEKMYSSLENHHDVNCNHALASCRKTVKF